MGCWTLIWKWLVWYYALLSESSNLLGLRRLPLATPRPSVLRVDSSESYMCALGLFIAGEANVVANAICCRRHLKTPKRATQDPSFINLTMVKTATMIASVHHPGMNMRKISFTMWTHMYAHHVCDSE